MKQSGLSVVRLLFLLALLAGVILVTYWRIPGAREMMDQKMPFLKDTLARFDAAPAPADAPADGAATTPDGAPAPAAMTFQTLAADPTSWPRTVRLKKAVQIPAVVGGKEVGKVTVNAGTEVNLAQIRDGKVGIEYHGGGAWLTPEETDVMERTRPSAPKPAPAP